MKMSIPHELSQQEALSRIKGMIGKLKQEQQDKITNAKEDWQDNAGTFEFTVQGFDLSGEIEVLPSSVDINAKLPFALSFFQGKIKEIIDTKAREILSK